MWGEREREREKKKYELSYLSLRSISCCCCMSQHWYLKYEISSYTPNCHKIRFFDVAFGTDMYHLIHCQGVAYSADVSSKPLSRCRACSTDLCHLSHCQGVACSADLSSKPLSRCSLQYRLCHLIHCFGTQFSETHFKSSVLFSFCLYVYVICNSIISLYSLHLCSVHANAEINTTYWSLK
jgi:hypothetical protein